MMMKVLYVFALLLWLPATTLFGQQVSSGNDSYNVLLILADDLNATLNSYGVKGIKTPNLDRLAERGMQFYRAYSQAPLCNPSRTSLMTGKRPHNLGIWNNEPHFRGIYPRIKTLPQYFKDHGYHSVGIGKIYHNWAQSIEGDPESWSEPQRFHWAAHYQDWYVPGRPYQLHQDLDKGPAVQRVDVPDEAYLDGRIADKAVSKLRELRETPYFLAVGFWKPHLPFNAPAKYWDLYDRDNLPEVKYDGKVPGVPDIAYVDSDEARGYTDVVEKGPISDVKKKELRHGYLASISFLDAQVGKILDELEKLQLADKTIIVFASDHGYHAGEHGQFGKWTNFEVGARVPLIISTPQMITAGQAYDGLVELIDLYPTLIELCELPSPRKDDRLDGLSLAPLLVDPQQSIKSTALSQIARPLGSVRELEIIGSSLRTDHYRYNAWIRQNTGEVVAEELYDLTEDVYNANNVVDTSRYADIKNRLKEILDKKLKN